MGVIQRQSIKYSIVSYLGVLVGIISALYIYPEVKDLYGFYQVLVSITVLFSGFFSFGISAVMIRFMPRFKDDNTGHHGFLSLGLITILVGFLLFLISYPITEYLSKEVLFSKVLPLQEHFIFIVPLIFAQLLIILFRSYISTFHRIVIPIVIEDFLTKLAIPFLCLLAIYNYIYFYGFGIGLIAYFFFMAFLFVLYTKSLGQLKFKIDWAFWKKKHFNEIGKYSSYSILSILASQLVLRIDIIMVTSMIGLTAGGIYSIINIMTQVIQKPANGMYSIASPIISESWVNNNTTEINKIYKKSSTILFFLACFIFLGIWLSIDDLIQIMPDSEDMMEGKYVMFFTGLSLVFELLTSVNSHIIGYSKHYQFNLYALLFLAFFNIVFNYIFISEFGLVGAAIATLCSRVLFNLLKMAFIYYKFKMQPFTRASLKIIFLALVSYGLVILIPTVGNPYLDIMVRSVLLALIYLPTAYFWKISSDINSLIDNAIKKVISFLPIS